jgi:hypothetical protein
VSTTLRGGLLGTAHIPVDGSLSLFVRMVEDFVASALDARPPTVTLGDSRGNAAALAALYRSAETGRVARL